jgi:hypothetical protein
MVAVMNILEAWSPLTGSLTAPTLVRKVIPSITVGTVTRATAVAGVGAQFATGANCLQIASDIVNLFPVGLDTSTILLYRQCTDTTARNTTAFGGVTGVSSNRVLTHAPFGDGNLYWDFGSIGSGRISVAFTKTTEPEVLVFLASPSRGREVWRDGVLIASNTGLTGAIVDSGYSFSLGSADGGVTPCDNETQFLFVIGRAAWPPALIRELSINPWQIFAPARRRIFVDMGAAAGPFPLPGPTYVQTMTHLRM